MALIMVGTENTTPINLYYEDHGVGTPVVLIHGWPLSGRSWEKQVPALIKAGFRVITYDRRGFGQSSQVATGYDANTLASDLDVLMTQLDLRGAILVGFSMGGVEVARYLGTYGSDRVSKAVFAGAVTPFLLKTEDNKEGVDASVFEDIKKNIIADRPKFLTSFFKDFYNLGMLDKISDEAVHMSWLTAVGASPIGTLKAVDSWLEDFRDDLRSIDIPALVIHGEADKTVPVKASGARMQEFVRNCTYNLINGAPHGLAWTHAEEFNQILLEFVGPSVGAHIPLTTSSPTHLRQ
ncbi:MAG: alpha/beta hydrolase [Bdellovibrionota bacterium]